MATKSIIIDFQYLRTNQALKLILTGRSINMNVIVMVYTKGGQQDVGKIQQNLMGQTKN